MLHMLHGATMYFQALTDAVADSMQQDCNKPPGAYLLRSGLTKGSEMVWSAVVRDEATPLDRLDIDSAREALATQLDIAEFFTGETVLKIPAVIAERLGLEAGSGRGMVEIPAAVIAEKLTEPQRGKSLRRRGRPRRTWRQRSQMNMMVEQLVRRTRELMVADNRVMTPESARRKRSSPSGARGPAPVSSPPPAFPSTGERWFPWPTIPSACGRITEIATCAANGASKHQAIFRGSTFRALRFISTCWKRSRITSTS
jgi:hypothetical protein